MTGIFHDLRYGFRLLIKQPVFTLVVLITLALGIGANAAIFSVVSGVMLKSLPYKEPDKIVFIWEKIDKLLITPINASSTLNYRDWKEQTHAFESMAAKRQFAANMTFGGLSDRVIGEQISADCFSLLGVRPLLGRDFNESDEKPGAGGVIILSEGLWNRRFGGDPAVIGQSMELNGVSTTIVGVVPNDYRPAVEFWTPLIINYQNGDRMLHDIQVVARLGKGTDIKQAQADIDTVQAGLAQQYPEINTGSHITLIPMRESVTQNVRTALLVLFGAVVLVLLIACANVANLLLARAATREREVAIRVALGAGRARLMRQVLAESMLLSIGGGAGAVFIAWQGTQLLLKLNPNGIPLASAITLDWRVLVFTLAASIISGLLFGLFPAFRMASPRIGETLKLSGRAITAGTGLKSPRSWLVIAEVALSVVLLAGAGLTIRSFAKLQQVQPGFDPAGLLSFQVFLPPAQYQTPVKQVEFEKEARRRLEELPGVQSAATVSIIPLANPGPRYIFWADGHPLPAPFEAPLSSFRVAGVGYFKTMGIPIVKGREFSDFDTATSQGVGVVNEEMASKMWPGEDPIGKRFSVGVPLKADQVEWTTVVGVVGGVRQTALSADPGMEMYLPYSQAGGPQLGFLVKTKSGSGSEPLALSGSAREVIASMNPDLPLSNIKSMEAVASESMAPFRFNTYLLAMFAVVALVLASVGVFGVINYSVTQRVQEIGVRMALGATAPAVRKMVIGQGMLISSIGLGIGLGGCLAVTRLMSTLLFEVSATDVATLGATAVLFALISLMACYLPARRATKIDPMIALRIE
ncbi:MAG TPA: ABC transporter permease [Blastocatellia bacterium]|nr:ABC transporter permease [Blastocatellia bacterium]